MKRTTSYWRKQCRNQNPEKGANSLCTAAGRPFFPATTTRTQDLTYLRAQRFSNLCLPSKNVKNAISKRARFFSPKGFFALKTQFGPTKRLFCKRRKIDSQTRSAKSSRFKTSKRSRRGAMTQNRSEIPCFEALCVFLPLRLRRHEPRRCRRKTTPRKSLENRSAPQASNMAFWQRARFHHSAEQIVKSANCSPQFRTTKLVVGRLSLMNIYIYTYIYIWLMYLFPRRLGELNNEHFPFFIPGSKPDNLFEHGRVYQQTKHRCKPKQ